ncbi:MAG: hypothetical protein RLZZ230_58 [Candidatus Parcubacteria bacterium]|jgi:hypothetical protein
MNDVPKTKKTALLKILAIFVFIGLITWTSIKLVAVAPQAFSSLASLAEGLNQYRNTLTNDSNEATTTPASITVTSNKTLVPAGDNFELAWSIAENQGTYTFSYDCTEGVALDILNIDGIRSINCNTTYNVGNVSTLSLKADSEKNRFSEVNYQIAFLATNDTTPRATGSASITIVNDKLSDLAMKPDTEPAPTEEIVVTETKTTSVTTKPAPTYQQEYVYTIPVSDPNGKTDMAVSFINTGRIVVDTFFTGAIKQNESGAIQFAVKNQGTKTSSDWTFSVTQPNGETYTSAKQKPLKPNERAVLTVGFNTIDKSSHNFLVSVSENTDKNNLNNNFTKTVTFLK